MKRRLLLAAALFVTTASLHAQDEEAPPSLVRRFDGTLGKNLGITLFFTEREISESGFLYDAAYHYHKSGLPIPLVHDAEAEGFQFREIAGYTPEGEEQVTGRWSITMEEDRITGTWTAPDGKKKLPIALKESYPAGSVKVERLKIDRAFVNEAQAGSAGSSIASMVVNLGRTLGMRVLAEGIETEEQAQMLTALGCHEGQGYLFARPMPSDALEAWMRPA